MHKLMGLSVAVLLIVAGCTSKSSEDLNARSTSTESQSGTDDSVGSRGTGSRPADDDDDDALDNLEDCLELSRAYFALTAASAGLALGDDEISEFEEDLDDIDEQIPDQLRRDFETVAQAYRAFVEAIKAAGGNLADPDTRQQLESARGELDDPEVQAASERIQQYFVDTCGG